MDFRWQDWRQKTTHIQARHASIGAKTHHVKASIHLVWGIIHFRSNQQPHCVTVNVPWFVYHPKGVDLYEKVEYNLEPYCNLLA